MNNDFMQWINAKAIEMADGQRVRLKVDLEGTRLPLECGDEGTVRWMPGCEPGVIFDRYGGGNIQIEGMLNGKRVLVLTQCEVIEEEMDEAALEALLEAMERKGLISREIRPDGEWGYRPTEVGRYLFDEPEPPVYGRLAWEDDGPPDEGQGGELVPVL